jgi:nucleotide-binding universal stress UspA family protein
MREYLMTGSIICGVDDSESAKGASRVARALSAKLRLRLVFVRVVEDGADDGKIAAIAARLHHPADRLVAAAEEENAALIVVGYTGPCSSLLGSISADVSRRAPCPVVVVAPGADRPLAIDGRPADINRRPVHDGYEGVSGSIRLGSKDRSAGDDDPDARDFAGGIVRFSLGGAKK